MVGLRYITGVHIVGIETLFLEICSLYRCPVYTIKKGIYSRIRGTPAKVFFSVGTPSGITYIQTMFDLYPLV
jgi:hypothetical protein